MLRKFVPIGPNKGRKYPTKRDEFGRSARQRAFELFDNGMRPAEVAPLVDVKPKTVYRYFQDWKKQGGNLAQLPQFHVQKAAFSNVNLALHFMSWIY